MKKSLIALALAMAAGGAVAGPTVIDFETVPVGMFSTLATGGYTLSSTEFFTQVVGANSPESGSFSGNGTTRVVSFNSTPVTLASSNGGAFSLTSFEGGESWITEPHQWARQIQVVGTLVGGGTTTAVFDLDLVKNAQTGLQVFSLGSSFHNLSKVTFTGLGGNPEFSLDNIAVNAVTAVPEPGTYAMLLAGLGLLGLSKRRKRAS